MPGRNAKLLVLVVCGLLAPLVAWVVCLPSCCQPTATVYRRHAFRVYRQSFDSLPACSDPHRVVRLDRVEVHIVGDRRHFDWARAVSDQDIQGYARRPNQIWLLGRQVKGRIVINQAVAGHELNHLLNHADPLIANPDTLDDLGA